MSVGTEDILNQLRKDRHSRDMTFFESIRTLAKNYVTESAPADPAERLIYVRALNDLHAVIQVVGDAIFLATRELSR